MRVGTFTIGTLKHGRTIGAAVLLLVLLGVGALPIGRAPAVGSMLDPAHGVWALARNAELPNDANDVLPTLGSTVEVRYDRRGVPHIFATKDDDAYRALGYVVARDRLFQLWLQTMAASGRLTEIAGAQALPLDREMRRLAIPWSAERKLALVDSTAPETARLARAYADGVNAYIDQMSRDELPLEFRLLGIKRVPKWEPVNSLLLFNRMGWTLAYIVPELERAVAASRVGTAAAASLFPENSPIQEPILPNGRKAPRFDFSRLAPAGSADSIGSQTLIAALRDFAPASATLALLGNDESRTFASNNWAVAPRRSANGDALLAGDPHLELSLPSIWYEAQLVVPGTLDVYGVTIPGMPAIVLGFNRDIAWTFTNTGADVLDFYTEKVDQVAQPTKYFMDGTWHPLDQRIEQYRGTRGELLAVDTLYFTHRGPLRRENGQWLSMRWTVLEQSNETEGFRLAAKAKDVDEFQRAMGMYFRSPAQNMLVADRHGTIAIRSTGRFPIRPDGGSGFTVRDGTTSASDWRSYLPVEFAPQARDPEQGFLASANQQPIDPRMANYWFGGQYETWRAMRINQLLRADSAMTIDKMRRFQTDPGSAFADLFVPYFLNAAQRAATHPVPDVDGARLLEAARLLGEWDRKYTKDNKRAVLFDLAYVELVNRTWDELIQPGPSSRGIRRVVTPSSEVLAELLADSTSDWWDDRRTSRHETRDDILAASLAAALDTARARYGDPAKKGWTWSRVRHVNIWHPLRLPSLSALDLPTQGGRGTLNPSSGAGIFGPSWRMVVDLSSNELKAWGTYPGGQSGNPASSRYKNHLLEWVNGDLSPLLVPKWIPGLSAKETASRLTLRARE
ncbi:MAG TPA: penicillin acylase family protein [Gemmatimonadaceae bacterium]|nr:penicillin acylase family protein [Gemmatimonadaceae bacterium]